MKKDIVKKFLFLASLVFVLSFNSVRAADDTTAPIIHLIGDTSVTIKVGEVYTDQSATAMDETDGDLTSSVVAVSNVDNSKPGIYSVTYDVSDSSSNKATQIIRTIIVTEVVAPPVVPVNIHLKVASKDESFYDQDISVSPCDSDGDIKTPDVATPYCALVQSGIKSEWSGLWINSIAGISNDNTNWIYWMWLANFDFSNFNLSSKQYELKPNDQILFYFNTNPLKISVDNNNPEVGGVATVKVEELGLDASWNPIWKIATGGKIAIGSDVFDLDSNGEYKINISDLNQIEVKGQKAGFIETPSLIIIPKEIPGNISGGNSGGSSVVTTPTPDTSKEFSISKALEFLSQNKKNDGSYGDPMYTDWAAIAAVAGNRYDLKTALTEYLKSNPVKGDVVTDYERRAMALMSLGINPYDGTSVNYIQKIIDSFDGTQFGDSNLLNDDIFAILVLKNAGYGESDEMIKKDLDYIVSKQSNGSWGSVDLTSAAIQAMYGFENVNQVSDAMTKGLSYLVSNQGSDGGFGNSFSTSWAIMSLVDENNISKAKSSLASLQGTDGGVGDTTLSLDTRIWATSYAIPATLHKSWDSILNNFSKQIIEVKPTEEVQTTEQQIKVTPVIKVEEVKKEVSVALEKPVIRKVKSTSVKNSTITSQEKIEEVNLVNKEDIKGNTPVSKSHTFMSIWNRIWSFIKGIFS